MYQRKICNTGISVRREDGHLDYLAVTLKLTVFTAAASVSKLY